MFINKTPYLSMKLSIEYPIYTCSTRCFPRMYYRNPIEIIPLITDSYNIHSNAHLPTAHLTRHHRLLFAKGLNSATRPTDRPRQAQGKLHTMRNIIERRNSREVKAFETKGYLNFYISPCTDVTREKREASP